MYDFFKKWPLLLAGLTLVGWGVTSLVDESDTSDPRAFVLGIGAMLMGSGLALIILETNYSSRKDSYRQRFKQGDKQ